jgi:CBS domain-containing protein
MRVNVRDVMTDQVVSIHAATPFKEVADTLIVNEISAVPVVDDEGRVLGVVSEADLMRKEEFREQYYREGYEPHGRFFHRGTAGGESRRKSSGETAGELMTAPAVTIRPEASAVRAARVMEEHGVKRLPVVDEDGKLAGIISRRDIVRVFVRDDFDISREIRDEVLHGVKWMTDEDITVLVDGGVVTLSGRVATRSLVELAIRLAQRVNGVVTVHSQLTWEDDDLPAWGVR